MEVLRLANPKRSGELVLHLLSVRSTDMRASIFYLDQHCDVRDIPRFHQSRQGVKRLPKATPRDIDVMLWGESAKPL